MIHFVFLCVTFVPLWLSKTQHKDLARHSRKQTASFYCVAEAGREIVGCVKRSRRRSRRGRADAPLGESQRCVGAKNLDVCRTKKHEGRMTRRAKQID